MAAFLFGAVLQPAACGSGKFAATMHLIRTEGTVGVSDVDGSALASWAMGLYSGWQVETWTESCVGSTWTRIDKEQRE